MQVDNTGGYSCLLCSMMKVSLQHRAHSTMTSWYPSVRSYSI